MGGYLQAAIPAEHKEKGKGVGGFVVPESGLRHLPKDGGRGAENSLRVSLWIKMLLCLIKLPEKPEPAGNENFKRMR